MKAITTFLFLLFASNLSAQSINEIRTEFHAVVLNPDDSRNFHNFLKDIENPTSTVKAYQAVSEALLAQVVWNPFNKLKQVVKYDKQIEAAVKEDPQNIEIRFLRLAIECNLPSFLGMSTHMDEDVDMIVSDMSGVSRMKVNPMFGQYIFHFLEETNLCSSEQLALMKQSFNSGAVMAGAE
ncbi:hypothetical protein [Ekhidna sp. To15]|uniref:hypothetical protein n=1 Tax=Ekhidna sp. To15 TaxID=3395267 RepID=UPI003F51D3FC